MKFSARAVVPVRQVAHESHHDAPVYRRTNHCSRTCRFKEGLLVEFEPKIIGFLCNWCSYAGADLAGVSRIQYPPNIRIIRVMCSGRVDPVIILEMFASGADGVLVTGCHPGDCHYLEGNLYEERKIKMLKKLIALTV